MDQNSVVCSRKFHFKNIWKPVLFSGLVAGTLDALGPVLVNKVNPAVMFKYIASGAFGADRAFAGGTDMVISGVLFHYVIAYSWTFLFFILYSKIPLMRKNRLFTGVLYGIFVWIVMNRVVIPLSQIQQGPFNLQSALTGAAILIVAIGLPISFLTHHFYSRGSIE